MVSAEMHVKTGALRPQITLAFGEPFPPPAAERLPILPNQLRLTLSLEPSDFRSRSHYDEKCDASERIQMSNYLCDVLHK